VRRLSDKESYSIITSWLERCNLLKRLSFEPRYVSKHNTQTARRVGYYPISWKALKLESFYLYEYLAPEKSNHNSEAESIPSGADYTDKVVEEGGENERQ
jgi:hypothetical protein